MRADSVDVLVIGGGLVGASAAVGAAQLGLSVAVVEQRRPQPVPGRLGMELRTVALAPSSRAVLAELGVWPEITPTPYASMRVWEERGAAELCFDAASVGRTELGWIAEVNILTAALWRRLEACPAVDCRVGEPVGELVAGAEGVEVRLGNATLGARLVIAADGAHSAVREQLGVAARELTTDQVAMVTIARTARPHAGIACQRFLLDGPLALLPGNDAHRVSVIWSQSATSARRRERLADGQFRSELARASGVAEDEILDVDRRVSFPVTQMLAEALNPHPRVLIIGDAARVIHPLAGLGVNLGFEDVAGVLKGLRRLPAADPGAPGSWRAFARRRKARGMAMMSFLAALRAFYGMPQPVAHWLRNSGVRLVDGAGPLKRQLIREALGLGPVAKWLR